MINNLSFIELIVNEIQTFIHKISTMMGKLIRT